MSAQRAIGWMAAHAGLGEKPAGSNFVPGINDWLVTAAGTQMGPGPWCAAALSRAVADGGGRDLFGMQFANGVAYVPYLTAAARSRGLLLPPRDGLPGDAVIYRWGGPHSDPNGDHCGLLETTDRTAGLVVTWEGNADVGGRDAIGIHRRSYGLVVGVVRLAYPADVPADPETTVVLPPPPPPSAAYPPGFSRPLSLRSPELRGPDVSAFQQRMVGRGWTGIGRVDGWFGPKSDAVTRQFQSEKRLVVDGIAGPVTLAAAFRNDNIT